MRWLLIFCLVNARAQASTVLVQAPESSRSDYLAELKAHAGYVSPAQEYRAHHPETAAREKLIVLFAEAQKAFLNQTEVEAKAKFEAVVALFSQEDWATSDREVFLQTFLRLAQLEAEPRGREHWLERSLSLGPGIALDATLYPPPLVVRRAELLKQAPAANFGRRLLAEGWQTVLTNGVPCDTLPCKAAPLVPGPIRVTVLSDQWRPQTAVLRMRDLDHWDPDKQVWVEGACGQDHWPEAARRFANRKAFWSLECERPNLSLVPRAAPTAAPSLAEAPPAAAPPLYKNKWIWIAAGLTTAAITFFVIRNNTHTKEVKEPTTTYSY